MRNALITMLASAGFLLAQAPRAAHVDALKTYLNLSDAQVQALQQMQQQDQQTSRAARQKLRQSQADLDDMLQKGGADATTTGKLMLDIREQQASLGKGGGQVNAQAAALLTPEQKTKLAALQSALELMPAIHQASALGLLATPQAGGGESLYHRGRGGPGRHGPPPPNN